MQANEERKRREDAVSVRLPAREESGSSARRQEEANDEEEGAVRRAD